MLEWMYSYKIMAEGDPPYAFAVKEEAMLVFHTDLDNTLIYSYKHDIGQEKLLVERNAEKELSYMTRQTHAMLRELSAKMLIVPTTTRTLEQYRRIDLQIGTVPYALVCNGGVLLVDGEEDADWYAASLRAVSDSRAEVQRSIALLEKDARRTFEVRYIKDLFVFTKCENPEMVVAELKQALQMERVEVFYNGTKVYVLPKNLTKGHAIERFKKYIGAQRQIAAGDSAFDIPMLQTADIAFAPWQLRESLKTAAHVRLLDEGRLFSEAVLTEILRLQWGEDEK